MKLKKIVVGVLLNLALISTANADIVFHSSSFLGADICTNVTGHWTGKGTVSTKVLGVTVRCDYSGEADVMTTSDPHVFTVGVSLGLLSGICPSSENFTIPGTCDGTTGKISLKSSDANLSGTLSSDGTAANLTGTVTIPVMGKNVSANVEKMELHKV